MCAVRVLMKFANVYVLENVLVKHDEFMYGGYYLWSGTQDFYP